MNADQFRTLRDDIRARFAVTAVAARAGVKLHREQNEWAGCCPFHADRSPSFTIYADDRRWHCFGCGKSGDVIDFVREAYNLRNPVEAIDMLDRGALAEIEQAPPLETKRIDRGPEALAIWRAAGPIVGTPAEAYLQRRGISMPLPPTLRFARLRYQARGPLYPTLVAQISDGAGRAFFGIQRTYLTEDGRKADVEKAKLSLGRIRGGAIKLAAADDEVILTEGLEDGLTLAQELGRAVWVAAGTSMMPSLTLPATVRSVVIGADGDNAGRVAAEKARDAFEAAGRTVRLVFPSAGYKDFNAELQGLRS